MVKISNGRDTFEVTAGAFATLYCQMGYMIVEEQGIEEGTLPPASPEGNEGGEVDPNEGNGVEGSNTDNGETDEESEEEPEAEDSDEEEKPVSEMDPIELRDYAGKLGIDTEGMTSKDIRKAIKTAQAGS